MLGYNIGVPKGKSAYGPAEVGEQFWRSNLQCKGEEESLEDCGGKANPSCTRGEVAGVICYLGADQVRSTTTTTTAATTDTTLSGPGEEIAILVRKEVGNPVDFFQKTFDEYKEGFSANGESWLGLERIHSLTSQRDYKLKIILTDFDGKKYDAVYDQFKVGPGDDYTLTVEGFNDALSTLGDSMIRHSTSVHNLNGMRFSTRDRDQDGSSWNCAEGRTGGWWYNDCTNAHLTGQHTDTSWSTIKGAKHIWYYHGGERGNSSVSWSEAEMLLLPN